LENHCGDDSISVKVTDEKDILELKNILKGRAYSYGPPSCPYGSISVTMANGSKSLTFYPATDGCPIIWTGRSYSDKYIGISDDARKRIDQILALKPCPPYNP
jgi:hypothetical protein